VGGTDTIAVLALPDGSAVVAPRAHERLAALDAQTQEALLRVANEVSIMLYESLQAHGTNILIRALDHAHALIVPRYENDGLPLTWEGKRATPGDLSDFAKKIGDEAWTIGKTDVTQRTNPTLTLPPVEKLGEPESVPVQKPQRELDNPDMRSPGDHKHYGLDDVAKEAQSSVKRGPTEEKDYRIRNLTRRR
jgi:hypothetical protein